MPLDFGVWILFIYGLIVGSFLNVLIYRMPREEPITTPPSHCPKGGKDREGEGKAGERPESRGEEKAKERKNKKGKKDRKARCYL